MSLHRILSIAYRTLIIAGILAFVYFFRGYILSSLLPFLIAMILAGMMEPAVNFLDRYLRVGRTAATTAVFVLVLIIGGYLTTLMTAKVIAEIIDMGERAGAYQTQFTNITKDILDRLAEVSEAELLPAEIQQSIEESIEELGKRGGELIKTVVTWIQTTASSIPSLILVITVTLLATFFMAKDRALIYQSIVMITPVAWREKVRSAQDRMVQDFIAFAKGQLIILAITTAVAALGLYLLGIRYWMTLSILAGILDFIPVVGPGFLFMPWAGVSLVLGDTSLAIALAIIYLAVFGVRQIFQTKVLGDSIGVHPLLMLISIYGGIVWFGVYGLLIGPVLIIIGRALINSGIIPWPEPVQSDFEPVHTETQRVSDESEQHASRAVRKGT